MQSLRKKKYSYNSEKNALVLAKREISLEKIVDEIVNGNAVDIKKHPNQEKYPNQELIYVVIDEKLYIVPCVRESEDSIFLKTVFRCSRQEHLYVPNKQNNKIKNSDLKKDKS